MCLRGKMNHKKRGQISVFIALGIIILIAVGLYFVVRNLGIPEPEVVVPSEIVPVKNYVESCIENTMDEAISVAGLQGGYVYLPNDLDESPFGHLTIVGNFKTPMWYYSGNNRVPELFEIEDGISRYVTENIDRCLNDFKDLTVYSVTKSDGINVQTLINREDVLVKVDMPVEINKEGQRFVWRDFSKKSDVKLLLAYETAKEVLANENKNMFLEDVTLDLMAIDTDIPLTDFRMDTCTKLKWSKNAIISRLKDTLYYNIPRLRVNGTDYEPFLDSEQYQKIHFLVDAIGSKKSDMTIGFRYNKDWNLMLSVAPSKGDTLTANSGKGFAKYLSFLCMNFYHFTYDVSYPVEVIVREDTSYDGDGFVFRFGMPVIIRNNEGRRDTLSETTLLVPEVVTDVCERKSDDVYEFRAMNPVTNEEVVANISYECVVFKCDLGSTELSSDGLSIGLKSALPRDCTGGYLVVNPSYDEFLNRGYLESGTHISLDDISENTPVVVPVKPYKLIELNFIKYDKDEFISDPIQTEGVELSNDEEILITLENESLDYYESVTWQKGSEENEKLKLMLLDDVTYDVTVMLIKDDKYIGGYNYPLTLSYSDSSDTELIEFPVLYSDNIANDDDTIDLITYIEGGAYANSLRPTLK